MNHTRSRIIGTLAAVLAAAVLAPTTAVAQSGGSAGERTATELGQAVGEPGERGSTATALYSRTPTELGQRAAPPTTLAAEPRGFDWKDAAIGAGAMLVVALLGSGAAIALNRRRRVARAPRAPAVSR